MGYYGFYYNFAEPSEPVVTHASVDIGQEREPGACASR